LIINGNSFGSALENSRYGSFNFQLECDDILVARNDGIIEAESGDGKPWVNTAWRAYLPRVDDEPQAGKGQFVNTTIPEPMLTFKLSDRNEYNCSACGHEVASAHNSRFIVAHITDLIAAFKTHVEQCHSVAPPTSSATLTSPPC
jgi:hypothetical protein